MLANWRIRYRIALALALPLLGIVFFALSVLAEHYQTVQQMKNLESLGHLAPEVSALVHELQRERGTTSGFLSSQDNSFDARLAAQRKTTSERDADFQRERMAFDPSPFPPHLGQSLSQVSNRLQELNDVRTRISARKMTPIDMADWYSGTIAQLLGVMENAATVTSDADITRQIVAYSAFLQFKERNGIERAVGANGFSSGQFTPHAYRRLVGLQSEQQAYLHLFEMAASPAWENALSAILGSAEAKKVEDMRVVALSSPQTGNLKDASGQPISGTAWFEAVTEKIEHLRAVEESFSNDIHQTAQDVRKQAERDFWTQAALTAVLMLVTGALVVVIVQGITRPLHDLTEATNLLATGNLDAHVPGVGRLDEIGQMSHAVEVFKEALQANKVLEQERDREVAARMERAQRREGITQQFNRDIEELVQAFAASSTELHSTAASMSRIADKTTEQATIVSQASEEAAGNVGTVAAAAEELTASIQEISRQVSLSSDRTHHVQSLAQRAETVVSGLSESSGRIGEVVELIDQIASQTNLLALNATIEAARAGETGKGFAVVANEVKSLATQTGKATGDIASQIATIQAETQTAVDVIAEIAQAIDEVSATAAMIAEAVSQQDLATREIAQNVALASEGTNQVSNSIHGVSQAADDAGAASGEVLSATEELARQSARLQQIIADFLQSVK